MLFPFLWIRKGIIVKDGGHMKLNRADPNQILKSITNEYLELIILPTEKCNFRCLYCYEDFSIGKMKAPVVKGIKNLIRHRVEQQLKQLRISWFGGEPLLAKNVIVEISQFATQMVENFPDFKYVGAMTTNGYLLDIDLLQTLVKLGIRDYQISLDGIPEIHNKTRLRADGKETFDRIWNNLLHAKMSVIDFEIMLRLHVTPENLFSFPLLIEMIKKEFSFDHRFCLFFKAIEDLGGPKSKTFEVLHSKNRKQVMQELYDLVGMSMRIEKVESRTPYICYAAQANSFLVRATGSIGKCTVALNDERNDIGHITPEGYFKLKNGKLAPWIRGLSTFNLNNLACPLMGLPKNNQS